MLKPLIGTWKLLVMAVAAIALGLLSTSIAHAAAPANDDFRDATVIAALPFGDAIDTTEATTERNDPSCAGNGHTVWYAFTAPADMSVSIQADTFGSDYDTTLSVYTGSRRELTQIACNDDFFFPEILQSQVFFDAVAGETYHFMVGSFADSPGGNLVLTVQEGVPPPPLELDLSIDPVGSVAPSTGLVTLHGTVTCSNSALVDLFVDLEQRVGRVLIHGGPFGAGLECSGETPWSATFSGENGLFVAGRAQAFVSAFACDPFTCALAETSAAVRLQGSP